MRLEVVALPEIVDAILSTLSEKYFASWSLMAWVTDVAVVRAEKYAVSPSR